MTKATYLKTAGLIAAAAFAITSAILIGDRLSTDAMAVLAGAVCGMGAAIPTSLLIATVTRRVHQAEPAPASQPQFTQPIIIPPMQLPTPAPQPPPTTWGAIPTQRHFTHHTIGEMGEEE